MLCLGEERTEKDQGHPSPAIAVAICLVPSNIRPVSLHLLISLSFLFFLTIFSFFPNFFIHLLFFWLSLSSLSFCFGFCADIILIHTSLITVQIHTQAYSYGCTHTSIYARTPPSTRS